MFIQLVKRPLTLARYRNGPFAQKREQYLTHLSQRGYRKLRLTGICAGSAGNGERALSVSE
jgi:hypothetical protein